MSSSGFNSATPFLDAVGTSVSGDGSKTPDQGQVLAVIDMDDVKSIDGLASRLPTRSDDLTKVVGNLVELGFVEKTDDNLRLSEIGKQALQYSRMTTL